MPYNQHLDIATYDGSIGSIRIKWSIPAQQRLVELASRSGVLTETLKTLTEHFIYAVTVRLGNTQAVIQSPPHEISVNSATGQACQDPEHLTAELSGGSQGRKKVHVYLDGRGTGATAYNNIWVSGESVLIRTKNGYVLDTSLSRGTYAVAGASGPVTTTPTTAPAATATTAATSTSVSSASVVPTGNAQSSQWEWSIQHQRYKRYNYTSQKWEWSL